MELDAILKGCGKYGSGVSMTVICQVDENTVCEMPDDTPDCPLWIEYQESQTLSRSEDQ